jgi:hypothetical protein
MNRRSLLKRAAGTYSIAALGNAVEALANPYSRPKLKITDIRTAEVREHALTLDSVAPLKRAISTSSPRRARGLQRSPYGDAERTNWSLPRLSPAAKCSKND